MDKKDKELEFLRGLEKLKAAPIKSENYSSDLDKDVVRVKGSAPQTPDVTRIKGGTPKIDTKQIQKVISGSDFQSKIQAMLKKGGKKALAGLPMVGAGMAALSGDPAMAAEEAAMDLIPGAEALRSDDVGMSPEEEMMMLEEIDARKNYDRSPARLDKLKKLMQRR